MMRRLLTVAAAGTLLVMMLPMASATATPPMDVTFNYTFFFGPPESGFFTTTGSAVDEGPMCSSGTLETVFFGQSENEKNATVVDKFICNEEDTFIMKAQVHIDFPNISGSWVIVGGTGAFEDIHGTGSTDGTFIFDPSFGVSELRPGNMHLD